MLECSREPISADESVASDAEWQGQSRGTIGKGNGLPSGLFDNMSRVNKDILERKFGI